MPITELEADLRSITKKPATFAAWLNTANEDDVNVVLSFVRDADVPADPLTRRLRAHGIPITQETIKSYREGNL